ncbi:MAG: ABC transporter substrate-binding protein [Pseudomonadota bacterium]
MCAAAPVAIAARSAWALDETEAREHVRATVDEVLALVRAPGASSAKAGQFRAILERRAAMPQIARFAAGVAWREMNERQQSGYTDAFSHFVSTVYAKRFQEYSGEKIEIGRVRDAGRRGLVVESRVNQPGGGAPIAVEWLVSDRPGRIVVADIVIEGVSLLVTQREEIGAMLDSRGGDVERLISDLAGA